MLLLLLTGWLGTAQAGDRDCVTTDNSWRYVTESDGASWRVIHDKNVLSEQSSAVAFTISWHEDTRRNFASTDPGLALFAIEATVRHPGGQPLAEGLPGEQRLDLRCAETGGPPSAARPAPEPKPAPVAPAVVPVKRDAAAKPAPPAPEPAKSEPGVREPVVPPPPLPVPEVVPQPKKKGKRR